MVVLVNNKETYEQWKPLVEQFETELFLPSFPNEDEREPFENIIKRITGDSYPITALQLIINNDIVEAGCVSDYYPECNAIEPIYLVVREECRKRGLARALLESVETLYPKIVHTYLEIDNPKLITSENSAIDPRTRLTIYERLGFRVIPFNYVQPPLKEGGNYERGLLLMHRGNQLTSNDLKLFLFHFYRGLKCADSVVLQEMYKEIEKYLW